MVAEKCCGKAPLSLMFDVLLYKPYEILSYEDFDSLLREQLDRLPPVSRRDELYTDYCNGSVPFISALQSYFLARGSQKFLGLGEAQRKAVRQRDQLIFEIYIWPALSSLFFSSGYRYSVYGGYWFLAARLLGKDDGMIFSGNLKREMMVKFKKLIYHYLSTQITQFGLRDAKDETMPEFLVALWRQFNLLPLDLMDLLSAAVNEHLDKSIRGKIVMNRYFADPFGLEQPEELALRLGLTNEEYEVYHEAAIWQLQREGVGAELSAYLDSRAFI